MSAEIAYVWGSSCLI